MRPSDARPFQAVTGFLVAALLLCARPVQACAVCGAGDPTLTVMGNEKTFQGRLRASAELRVGGARVGEPGRSEIALGEERVELSAAYAPTPSLMLIVAVPLLARQAVFPRSTGRFLTLGDVELRAKQFVFRAHRGPFTHQVALQWGVKAPTAPVEGDDRGDPLPSALQPGMGSVAPFAGLFYGLGRGPWSFYASATAYLPFAVRATADDCDSLRTSASVQRQVGRSLAARIGLDTRLDSSGQVNGVSDPNSGGFVAYLSPTLVVSPVTDLLLGLGAHFPFAQALHGFHHESGMGVATVTYDF